MRLFLSFIYVVSDVTLRALDSCRANGHRSRKPAVLFEGLVELADAFSVK